MATKAAAVWRSEQRVLRPCRCIFMADVDKPGIQLLYKGACLALFNLHMCCSE